jgi:Sulfotransferase domain
VDGVSPVLVHIGYHKTGTKWLRAALFRDPATGYGWVPKDSAPIRALVRDRPLDFDPAARRAELEPLVAEVETAGLLPVVCWGRLAGQAFSGGHDVVQIADRLHAVLPEARILAVVREQRSIIVSTYKQYVKAGGAATLQAFLEPADDQGWRVPTFDYAYFEYHRLLGYYRSLFGPESVLVLPYEQLVQDRREFVTRVAEFAGRSVPEEALERMLRSRPTNPAQSALVIGATRPLNRFGPRNELNPSPVLDSRRMAAFTAQVRKRVDPAGLPGGRALAERSERRLREAVAAAVGDRYAESNRATSELFGLDLERYGWPV